MIPFDTIPNKSLAILAGVFLLAGCASSSTTTNPGIIPIEAPPADAVVATPGTNVAGAPRAMPAAGEVSATPTTIDRELREDQLPTLTRELLGLTGLAPQAAGELGHPFTTKRASAFEDELPVSLPPWHATGKLIMSKGPNSFVCTASVIERRLLVTAAHCVHEFGDGQDGFVDSVRFEPGRHDGSRPFGTWTAEQWWVPTVYFNGTDVCSDNAQGVVCENDIALVVLQENANGEGIGDVIAPYRLPTSDQFGYVQFLGEAAGQITQLGYPSKNYSGTAMIRTDSLGYHQAPNNVVIGSNQTGGSSGGPWLMNFGTDTTSFSGSPANDNTSNVVVATTSWGFTSGTAKVQGASRFSKNAAYPTKSNIQSLMESACAANAGACSP